MNTLVFAGLIILAQAYVVWIAYSLGHSTGWLEGVEMRRTKE
jgi:hypothetical protein